MLLRKLASAFGLSVILAGAPAAGDLPTSGTSGFNFVCTTALNEATGNLVSTFAAVTTSTTPPRFVGQLVLPAVVAASPNRRFQAARLETAIAHDPTEAYAPPAAFGVFFVPTDAFGGSPGSITVIDARGATPVVTTLGMPSPLVYDVELDPEQQRAFCAYVRPMGTLEVQTVSYVGTPVLLGPPVVLTGTRSVLATEMTLHTLGARLYVPQSNGVGIVNNVGIPTWLRTLALPPTATAVTNVDTDFPFNDNHTSHWNICAMDAPGSASAGANVLVFNTSGTTVLTLPGGFGAAPSGMPFKLASGFNDLATISGWIGLTNPSFVLLRDPAGDPPQGAVGRIDNMHQSGALVMTVLPTMGEPFGNPNMALAPQDEIAFHSWGPTGDFVAVLPRAIGATLATTMLQGFLNTAAHDMPVIAPGSTALSVRTEFAGMSAGFETFGTPPPLGAGIVLSDAPSISLSGAWRGTFGFPLTAVATRDVAVLVQGPGAGFPYLPIAVPGGTGGRQITLINQSPFVPAPPSPPDPVTLGAILGPKRPAYNLSGGSDLITDTNVAFDGGVNGAPGSAMAILTFGGALTPVAIPPRPNLVGLVLSTEILSL